MDDSNPIASPQCSLLFRSESPSGTGADEIERRLSVQFDPSAKEGKGKILVPVEKNSSSVRANGQVKVPSRPESLLSSLSIKILSALSSRRNREEARRTKSWHASSRERVDPVGTPLSARTSGNCLSRSFQPLTGSPGFY